MRAATAGSMQTPARYLTCVLLTCLGAAACSHQQPAVKTASLAAPAAPPMAATPPSRTAVAPAPPAAAPPRDESIYFTVDNALIAGDASAVLKDLGQQLLARPRTRVRIEGNCD